MSGISWLKHDREEAFPALPRPPIAEAVVEILAQAARDRWEQASITQAMKERLSEDFPSVESLTKFQGKIEISGNGPVQGSMDRPRWHGLRCASEDTHWVAQILESGMVCSRLRPYEGWDALKNRAMQVWNHFVECAAPMAIHRLGVRFVNAVELPVDATAVEMGDYLRVSPEPPAEPFEFVGFLYLDEFDVAGSEYRVRTRRTIQPTANSSSLVLDFDVFYQGDMLPDSVDIERRLDEMRWIKNKAFYGTISEKLLKEMLK